ncbi:peptide ligase PGM1-related protein [Spongiactinospora sp. TRM90649]|uniref:peptide ligase PGM1-related protein n=1 Tax=Spongiactinospora sp. TRM90649 TaxID=3031114 RepID=UPI0023F848C1|nr:peptide ligase PGM1-related protein [Spongiactinospora sp. TRM90649]MDF5751310.1 peptide ligase PGM1-related protein [Spongiactinospora sp. TRM90649]
MIVPSLSLPQDELRRITGVTCYEERLLFLLLTLRRPGIEVIYLSSRPVDEEIIEYYLGFLDDPVGARARLHLISTDEPDTQPLTRTIVRRRDLVGRIRELAGSDAWLVPFVVSEHEERLAAMLAVPIYGPALNLAHLGSKSGSREVGEEAGVPMPRGTGDLYSLPATEQAAGLLKVRDRLIVKLNDGYSGLGNAVVRKIPGLPLTDSPTSFSADEETWETFGQKISERGAVIEEFIEDRPLYSPSALAMITPGGHFDVIATHDQVLGGANADVFKGCTFPARKRYRHQVGESARRIAGVLAERGVVGLFGMDFFALKTDGGYGALLCEINLRIGGTTHPYGATVLTTGATYDPATGTLMDGPRPKYYTATDNCASPHLLGRTAGEIIRLVEGAGLGFDAATRTGNVLHMLGAVPEHGKLGFTSIGDSREHANELHRATLTALGAEPAIR